ncbi:MAG: DUF4168 domain-containing protein [Salinivirgaceae bacterium]
MILKRMAIFFLFATVGMGLTAQPLGGDEPTDDELLSFVEAAQKIQMLDQQAQEKMVQEIESEDMDVQTYIAIQQGQSDPQKAQDVSEEDMEKFQKANKKVSVVQQEVKGEMEKEIESTDLTVDRYQSISQQVQNDPELGKRVQDLMKQE